MQQCIKISIIQSQVKQLEDFTSRTAFLLLILYTWLKGVWLSEETKYTKQVWLQLIWTSSHIHSVWVLLCKATSSWWMLHPLHRRTQQLGSLLLREQDWACPWCQLQSCRSSSGKDPIVESKVCLVQTVKSIKKFNKTDLSSSLLGNQFLLLLTSGMLKSIIHHCNNKIIKELQN